MTDTPQWLYFIRPVGMRGPVKIGYSTVPENRLSVLMAWSPFPLEIAAKVPGGPALEARVHAVLAGAHSHREWFFPTDSVVKMIEDLQRGLPVERAIDLTAENVLIKEKSPRSKQHIRSEDHALCNETRRRLRRAMEDHRSKTGQWVHVPPRLREAMDSWQYSFWKNPPNHKQYDHPDMQEIEAIIANPGAYAISAKEHLEWCNQVFGSRFPSDIDRPSKRSGVAA